MNCIIVDDDPIDIELAAYYASMVPGLHIEGKYNDALQAFSVLNLPNNTDLVLCDIDMPNLSGMDMIKALKNPPQVIFLTNHPDLAIEGFEVEATDYLLKPYSFERFMKAIRKAMKKGEQTNEDDLNPDAHFFIRSDQQYVKVRYSDIIYIEALKDYVKIVTAQRTLLTAVNLKTVTESLPATRFFRASRSLVVNLDKVEALDNFELTLQGHTILLSETTARNLHDYIVKAKLVKRL